jgi:hypothetical protein
MKKEIKLLVLVCTAFAAFAAFTACRPTLDFTPIDSSDGKTDGLTYRTASNSYADIFTAFWQGMDANYVFWDVEPTGYWDEVWNKYKPLFDALGDYDAADASESAALKVNAARRYIQEMVNPLKDGHLNVRFEFYSPLDSWDYSQNDPPSYSPATGKVNARYSLPKDPNTNPRTIFRGDVGAIAQNDLNSVFPGVLQWGETGPSYDPFRIATGKIDVSGGAHIRYLYFNKFAIKSNLGVTAVAAVTNAFLNGLDDPACKGVIFDLRGNRGGANEDIPLLLAPLLTSDLTFAHTRLKKGAGRLNYMPWAPYILNVIPAESVNRAANAGKIPVVALINDYSVSCGEIMPMAVKVMPKGRLIGTRTWGGTGPHWQNESPNYTHGGCFTHNKLWTQVYQAGYQTRGLHFESYEGADNGVPPDEEVEFDLAQFTNATTPRDVQLQAAIRYVESGQ